MDPKTDTHLKSPLIPKWFWLFGGLMFALWIFTPSLVSCLGGNEPPTKAGEFGDQYGFVNALFSGLALLGVMAGILIQGQEFRSQLREMAANSEEMQKQTKTYEAQLELLRHQNNILARQQLEAQIQERLAAQPFLTFKFSMSGEAVNFWIRNHGSPVYGLVVHILEIPPASSWTREMLSKDDPEATGEVLLANASAKESINVEFAYTTRMGHRMRETFSMTPPYHVDRMKGHSDMATVSAQIRQDVQTQAT